MLLLSSGSKGRAVAQDSSPETLAKEKGFLQNICGSCSVASFVVFFLILLLSLFPYWEKLSGHALLACQCDLQHFKSPLLADLNTTKLQQISLC